MKEGVSERNKDHLEFGIISASDKQNENNISCLGTFYDVLLESIDNQGVLLLRHSDRPSFDGMMQSDRDAVSITPLGVEKAVHAGRVLDVTGIVMSSPVPRCLETARHLSPDGEVVALNALCGGPRGPEWSSMKEEIGWYESIRRWLEEELEGYATTQKVGEKLLGKLDEMCPPDRISVAVSHDQVILAVANHLGIRTDELAVPFLGGIFVVQTPITSRFPIV